MSLNTNLTQEELQSWGVDDSVVMKEIAIKMGTNVIETFTGSTGYFGF